MAIKSLRRSTPEQQRISSSAIMNFVNALDDQTHDVHSFMLMRHGKVVSEGWWQPYAAQYPHVLFSLSKSFTSSAVGLAVSERRLSIDDTVVSFFPDDLPASVSENLAAMRVRHLLSMSTGQAKEPSRQAEHWVKSFLAAPVEHVPGTQFLYNSLATYMCSAIVQKLTGMRLVDYLMPRLFEPLGIERPTWEQCPRGINVGGWGLSVKTEDIARFGQMYLQQGVFGRRRILTAQWVAQATSKQVSNGTDPNNDWNQGYGFQFWRCRHGVYRGDGAFGQYCIVMPQQDAVLAITAGLGDMGHVMNLAWQHLLPAMQDTPLTADKTAQGELKRKCASLGIAPLSGKRSSPRVANLIGRTCRFGANDQKLCSAKFQFDDGQCRVVTSSDAGDSDVAFGFGQWIKGIANVGGQKVAVAGSYAWSAEDTLVCKMYAYETPFAQTLTYQVSGDKLTFTRKQNVSFGPTLFGPVTGTLA